MHFKYPFIYFSEFGIKYSLIIFLVMLLFLIIVYLCNTDKYKISYSFSKVKTVKVLLVYILLIPFHWWSNFTNNQSNILIKLCNIVLSVEALFAIVMTFLIIYGLVVYSNKETYFKTLIFPVTAFLYIDILSVIVTKQVDFFKYYNIMSYTYIGAFIWIINNIRFEKRTTKENSTANESSTTNENSETKENSTEINKPSIYGPIDKIEDLFVKRIWQAEELKNLINNWTNYEPLSICISGEWGIGKTSFVNAVLNSINGDTRRHIIRINTIDMDSMESLFKYLFQRIKSELKKENFYIGISSEFQDYISSTIEIVSGANIKSNLIKNLFGKKTDYRENKKHLEEMICKMLGNDKLIIVVDDIERCDSNKVVPFINFIKEIATFKNCIVIFLTDYEQLDKIMQKQEKPIVYLDKFFNYRINLINVYHDDIIRHFIEKGNYKFILYENIELSVLYEINGLISKLRNKISNVESQNGKLKYGKDDDALKRNNSEIESLKKMVCFIEINLKNPRKVTKLLSYIEEECGLVKSKISNGEKSSDEISKYLSKVEASRNITIISLVKTIMPEEFERIQDLGINTYVNSLRNMNSDKNSERELLARLVSGLWYKIHIIDEKQEYNQYEIMKFMTRLLESPSDLNKDINEFTSYDEKFIAMLKKENYKEIESESLIELFEIVVRNFSNQESKDGEMLIEKLFAQIAKGIEEKKLKSDVIFKIFHSDYGIGGDFPFKLKVWELFYKYFCKNREIKVGYEDKKQFNLSSLRYADISLQYLTDILVYHIHEDDYYNILNSAKKEAIEGNTFDGILDLFCKELDKYFTRIEDTNIKKIESYLNECKVELNKLGYMEKNDVKKGMECAVAQLKEYKYLKKVIEAVEAKPDLKKKVLLNDINIDNVIDKIDKLMEIIETQTLESDKTQIDNDIRVLFNSVRYISGFSEFSSLQVEKLNNLISTFGNKYQTSVTYYRKIMVDISRIQQNKSQETTNNEDGN